MADLNRTTSACLLVCVLVAALPLANAGEQKLDVEYGPFLSATFGGTWPRGSYTYKGIAVRLDPGQGAKEVKRDKDEVADNEFRAGIIFDTELLRVSAGWMGAPLRLQGIPYDMQHGLNPELFRSSQVFGTRPGPGWSNAGNFSDPRAKPFGPLPAEWAKYKGLYRHGSKIVFSYTVGKTNVLESHAIEKGVILREFTIGPAETPLELLACETDASSSAKAFPATMTAAIEDRESTTAAKLIGAPAGVEFAFPKGTAIAVKVPASPAAINFKVALWNGPQKDFEAFSQSTVSAPIDLATLTRGGGQNLWTMAMTGEGKVGQTTAGSFTVDTLPILESPMLRPTAFDFFKDGRAAVSTLHGDVWIVSGIDADLKKVVWRRFASGLYQPLGLRIVNDEIYVLGRDQITRLKDLAGGGEADFYENFNNATQVTENFHEFAMDLQTDSAGNFYFCKAGPVLPGGKGFDKVLDHHGCLLKVSPDGAKIEVVATGLRAANGMSVGPKDEITTADQEGTWVPASRINLVKPGGFYGCPPLSHMTPVPTVFNPPLCWIPHNINIDNSSAGQVWVPPGKWGPLGGSLLHLSYGQSSLFLVNYEIVDGFPQGGVTKIPLQFRSGILRGRFNPADGHLYLCGLRGWQTTGLKWGCFQRVRYNGGPVHLPSGIRVTRDGIYISFHCTLDKTIEPDDFSIDQWTYRWTEKYGSDQYLVSNPNEKATTSGDVVSIKSAQLQPDQKTVFLQIPGIRPVMQMRIKYSLKAEDGTRLKQEIYNTINALPPQ